MPGPDWNADQYLVFETERTRAAIDLIARIPEGERRAIVDLGCGPGNSTRLLAERFASSEIVGIDTSEAMLDAARASLTGVRFIRASVETWRMDAPVDLIQRPQFRGKLAKAAGARERIATFPAYCEALAPLCEGVDLWRTTYAHRLAGPDAIVEWMKGTGLRPFLGPLSPDERAEFLAQYHAEIARAYPALANGEVLLPFPRLFIVAARGHG